MATFQKTVVQDIVRFPHWEAVLESLYYFCQFSQDLVLLCGPSGVGKSVLAGMLLQSLKTEVATYLLADPDWDIPTALACIQNHDPELLILDDVQVLESEVLEAIIKVSQDRHVLLIGTPEVLEQCESIGLSQEMGLRALRIIELLPLSWEETRFYLHRVIPTCDPATLRLLHERSGGVLALLNHDLEVGLEPAVSVGRRPWAMIGLALGLASIGIAVMWMEPEVTKVTSTPANHAALPVSIIELKPPVIEPPVLPVVVAAAEVDPVPEPVIPEPVVTPEPWVPEPEPAPAPAPTVPIPAPISVITPPVKPKPIKTQKKVLSLLLQRSEQHYAIQIAGAAQIDTMRAYARQYHLGPQAQIFRTIYHGKPWFVLIYGDFKSKQEAQQAMKQLSPGIQAKQPWVRQYIGIHRAIRAAS